MPLSQFFINCEALIIYEYQYLYLEVVPDDAYDNNPYYDGDTDDNNDAPHIPKEKIQLPK